MCGKYWRKADRLINYWFCSISCFTMLNCSLTGTMKRILWAAEVSVRHNTNSHKNIEGSRNTATTTTTSECLVCLSAFLSLSPLSIETTMACCACVCVCECVFALPYCLRKVHSMSAEEVRLEAEHDEMNVDDDDEETTKTNRRRHQRTTVGRNM